MSMQPDASGTVGDDYPIDSFGIGNETFTVCAYDPGIHIGFTGDTPDQVGASTEWVDHQCITPEKARAMAYSLIRMAAAWEKRFKK